MPLLALAATGVSMDITAGALCLNCGTRLVGEHCHSCGQTGHIHRTVGAIGHDLLHGVFHFEGKVWRTLPMLFFRPGELTRRYVHGERARFVSPMALFLLSVFVTFTTLSILGIAPPAEVSALAPARSGIEEALRTNARERAETAADLAKLAADNPARPRVAKEVAKLDADARQLRGAMATLPRSDTEFLGFKTGWQRLDHGIEKANKNPGLMLYKLQANSYKFSWALIPLSVPFLWLLFFWRRDLHGYDHAVFVTYSLSFMSLLFIGLTLGSALGLSQSTVMLAAFLIPPVHIYKQLRGAYRLRRRTALPRTGVLVLFFIPVVSLTFFFLLLGLGLVG
jgi:hypothetical protein